MAVSLFACKWYASGTRDHLDLQSSFANQSLGISTIISGATSALPATWARRLQGMPCRSSEDAALPWTILPERMMRDTKLTQIFQGTNQIQRVVIARELLRQGFSVVREIGGTQTLTQ
jgi:hypothetical protein